MVIEKVFGLQSTGVSLSDRFALLTNAAPGRVAMQQRKRRASVGSLSQNYNYSNRANRLLDQVARQLGQQTAKRQPLKQRLGFQQGNLRRFGSESSLPGLKRSNSYGNLSQQSVKNRVNWRQSNGNLSRAGSLNNITNQVWRFRAARGFRNRGGGQRGMRGRFRGRGRGQGWRLQQFKNFQQRPGVQQRRGNQQRTGFQQRRGLTQRRGNKQRRGSKQNGLQQTNVQHQQNDVAEKSTSEQTEPQFTRPQTARRGVPRGRGRGGITRSQSHPMPMLMSKEQLDAQLDQYMSCTKAALDKELEDYMRNAMELE